MTKNPKSPDDNLAARAVALGKRSTKELAALYEKQFGRSPIGFPRNALIRALAATPVKVDAKSVAPSSTASTSTKPRAARSPKHDPRLPARGGTIEKVFKGKTIRVEVTADGLRHEGKEWSSLTALALHITGYKAISGPAFFGLTKPTKPEAPAPTPVTPTKKKAGRPISPRRSK